MPNYGNRNAKQNLERGNANFGTQKKSFEKACGNAEREEEMKERGHASREGPAGTRAQLCYKQQQKMLRFSAQLGYQRYLINLFRFLFSLKILAKQFIVGSGSVYESRHKIRILMDLYMQLSTIVYIVTNIFNVTFQN